MAAFGYYNEEKKPAFREGVKYFEDKGIDIFFITLMLNYFVLLEIMSLL